eukprot:gi/632978670/ref/XP_007906043.1/ PREDICTED: matrix metalloproteinase-17 [Callorhinchus milii]
MADVYCLSLSLSLLQEWLTKFGYLPPADPVTGQLQTQEGLTKAIRAMQTFGGLKISGILDQATLTLMETPRCSLPDIPIPDQEMVRRRRRRSAPSGNKWNKRNLSWSVALHTPDMFVLGHTHTTRLSTFSLLADAQKMDLFAVAVHEFGHALGLSHSSANNSIMRPYYQGPVGDPLKYQLPYDDKLRIWQLYGVRDLLISTSRPGAEEPSDYPALPKPPKSRPTAQLRPDAPDRCNAHFDAVAQIRGEAFFFKGKYFWRLTRNKHLVSLQPAQIQRFWWGLPSNLGNLDAVYERSVDHKIVFFKGSRYWVFKDNNVEEGYPRLLADFGLPVQGIEAAFVWPHNDKTYFFKDNQYWRYDDHSRRLDPEAPEESLLWKGLPSNIDDAMRWSDGTTYFFKGKSYWKVLDGHTEVSADSPRSIARDWLMCSDMQADGVEVELASSRHGHPDHTRSEEEEKKKQQQQQQPSCSCTSSAAQPSGPEAVWRQRAAHLVAGLLFATAAAAVV